MSKYLNTKPGSLESAVLEAVSPAQQAAIAISKKEKGEKPKKEEMDPTDHVKEKDGKFCVYNADGTIAKEFDNKEDADKYAIANHDKLMATKDEELSAKQKKLDKNNNGKIDGDDLAALRKSAKKEEVELEEETLAMRTAKHISDMWAEAAKKPTVKGEDKEEENDGDTTMTGKPMSKVKVAAAEAEKDK